MGRFGLVTYSSNILMDQEWGFECPSNRYVLTIILAFISPSGLHIWNFNKSYKLLNLCSYFLSSFSHIHLSCNSTIATFIKYKSWNPSCILEDSSVAVVLITHRYIMSEWAGQLHERRHYNISLSRCFQLLKIRATEDKIEMPDSEFVKLTPSHIFRGWKFSDALSFMKLRLSKLHIEFHQHWSLPNFFQKFASGVVFFRSVPNLVQNATLSDFSETLDGGACLQY